MRYRVRRVGHRVAHPDARIERGVQQVDEEVEDDEGDRGHQDAALDHREVPAGDGVERQLADARPVEDRLDDHRPGEEEAELEPDERDQRQRGDLQAVDEEHPPLGDAACPRRPDEVLALRLQERLTDGADENRA